MNWKEQLESNFSDLQFQWDEPMAKHTTFRIGGNADGYVEPTVARACDLMNYCQMADIPVTVLGNGSNVLVADEGIEGLVISFGKAAAQIKVEGNRIFAEAGALLSQVAHAAAKNELTGLEFAAGIPGSIGGALMMNAGAYGGEMKDVVVSLQVLLEDGGLQLWSLEDADLSYRHSHMMEVGATVLAVEMELKPGNKEEIYAAMEDFRTRRMEKQPLEFPSAGSTFKRPEGYFAGKLIMDAGLAGFHIGDAQVSEKHCGFVINKGSATATQVRQLIREVSETVMQKNGVRLEPEVRFLGRFQEEK